MANINLSSVSKKYGSTKVIHGIDFDIEPGEFAVLVGPSGCGKSTLLRMIAGLESISGGEVSIGDKVVNRLHPKDRDIAMVFQNYALYPHMTVAENMGFSLQLQHVKKPEIEKKVTAAAVILGLQDLLERFPRQLSGGQRQRVAMGRAIVRDPSVFLFDEPLSNLDAKLRVKMRSEIKELHQKLKTTIVYVTHDQIEAMTMADKIIVLNGGHISQVGKPLELYDNPQNSFVASFIGSPSMNLIPATAMDNGRLKLSTGQIINVPHQLETGKKIDLGIRPENLTLGTAENGIRAKVIVTEPTGAETFVNCSADGVEILASIKERVTLQREDEVYLQFDSAHSHIFCAKTGTVQ